MSSDREPWVRRFERGAVYRRILPERKYTYSSDTLHVVVLLLGRRSASDEGSDLWRVLVLEHQLYPHSEGRVELRSMHQLGGWKRVA